MDLVKIGYAGLAISIPIIIWDMFSKRNRVKEDPIYFIVHSAWLVLFVSGFGLLLKITGFSEILLAASFLTGLVLLWHWLRTRNRSAEAKVETPLVEISRSFFPVILAVFVVRSYLYEPFKIPSGSMIPTLHIGDFILVNKFIYGLRLPFTNHTFIPIQEPQRGDVMVFHYPEDPSVNYIKRVIGKPGDVVTYQDKRLTINGEPIPTKTDGVYNSMEEDITMVQFDQFREKIGNHIHEFITVPTQPAIFNTQVLNFDGKQNCTYNLDGFTCKVPAGHYFMMGDNRDRSSDSRYWGFVPEDNIVGKAVLIWMNFSDFGRMGKKIQ
ncbi:signal peptidase I [Ferrovum sp. PN-J185]|uniref:signal peptidase I n=1 Tax=Ferrovum sp. PN-J185 TaxID=1356306 RepID=UPI0007939EFF|nr:signal peptidase I [Ferrovum sp. PN-J185]KXW56829.1 signal peptidase I [Ferrovum sp. PN-J185]